MSAATGTIPAVHPFANAPVLPFAMGHDWFTQARSVWRRHVFFLAFATLLILVARWQLDLADRGVIIVLSYLSDAVVFTWVFLGLRESEVGLSKSPLSGGRQALRGRWRKVMLSSLWGLPAALASYLVFVFAPEAIKVLVVALGVNALGVVALVLVVMAGAYATFLLCMLPVLAGVHAARDGGAGFKVGGLWAFRALRCGWRPLLVVFVAFIVACFVAATALTWTFGHLPAAWFAEDSEIMVLLGYWYPWPGLLVAMNLFLALLYPMVRDLLAAADTDLSDEIASQAQKDAEGQRFVGHVWAQAAMLTRTAAAAAVMFGLVYGAVFNEMAQFTDWFGVAVVLYVLGGGLYKVAAWARQGVAPTSAAEGAQEVAAGVEVEPPVVSQLPVRPSFWRSIVMAVLWLVIAVSGLGGLAWLGMAWSWQSDATMATYSPMGMFFGGGLLTVALVFYAVLRYVRRGAASP